MLDFSKKVVIVTGGANGHGEAAARTFAKRGASVVIADKDGERTPLVVKAIEDDGGDAYGVVMNIRDEKQVADLVQRVVDRYGKINVLDNNAAAMELVADDNELAKTSTELFSETLSINVMGTYFMCKYVIPHMVENGGGAIINISSISGILGETWHTAYNTSKGAIIALSLAVAAQYGKLGVRCNAVAPSFVKTRNVEEHAPPVYEDIYKRNSMTPFVADPQDIANVVVFLASDEARYMTGHVVYADGGIAAVNPILADLREVAAGEATA
jgi:NAD(P)-dependent dehydrogenase (short-subunit alcohol dehydrogenase family)